ncbi:MFS transporter [Jannaschia seohaensis]|uniref:GPH family glycoside/pentoside/hexuronide:cation symporter n=1 Tax=Jannaschia seohaensis TaxID=475081 RepID=A0A2Y9B386_9RHOB|nr:MFS transporter [Jannaschia seohaensis]PWJ12509.1 GPH family glycoside/pentoside/hexuronide:cation symporter [Jannaschia seohaensis]SSA50990.1 glycoside/pentoside/hexuronide:cation symporter, GPH family [Jannaschia seohaensis]
MADPSSGLGRHAVFAAVLAAAGLPIYIHAPKFYVDTYGVTLAQLSVALFLLRLVDVVQDPLLGRLSAMTRHRRTAMAWGAGGLMAVSMVGLFAVPPLLPPVWWFALTLAGLFSGFSFLTICFYAQGVAKAAAMGDGHVRLAAWRETGALSGVCLAAALPALLAVTGAPFALYAGLFVLAAALALWLMRPEWTARGDAPAGGLREVLSDRVARRLLLIALANATPVAVTSTLFLFFVEDRLQAPAAAGPLLLLFFLSAAAAAPLWGRAARRWGARQTLMAAMGLAMATFAWALTLGAGDVAAFAAICVASGAAVGADLTLLPAIFARRLERVSPGAADGFGLWSFVNKITLALAAIALFPALDTAGFVSGAENDDAALAALTWAYAGLPLGLKALALALLGALGRSIDEETTDA